MTARDRAQQVAAATQTVEDWRLYKHLRNSVNRNLKIARKSWETKQLNSFSNNATDLWRNVKGWMGWKNSGPPNKLFHDGRIVTRPTCIASSMNRFFIDKVRTLRQNIPQVARDPLKEMK